MNILKYNMINKEENILKIFVVVIIIIKLYLLIFL